MLGFEFAFRYYWRLSFSSHREDATPWWQDLGKKTAKILGNLGGLYIKFGQVLSNASHLFPESFLVPLRKLQDNADPQPFRKIQKRFLKEWNRKPEEVLDWFQENPIASASIAQVYLASYQGSEVAVKVLYPGIEDTLKKDLSTLKNILILIHKFLIPIPHKELYQQLCKLFLSETDLLLELKNMEKMRYLFLEDNTIYVPRAKRELCTRGILVMEYIRGTKWNESSLNSQSRRMGSNYGMIFLDAVLKMVFQFRFFHADPHPGNLLIMEDGRLCFLDFGAVGMIREEDERGLLLLIQKILEKDSRGVLEAMVALGILDKVNSSKNLLPSLESTIQKIHTILGKNGIQKHGFSSQDWELFAMLKKDWESISASLPIPPSYVSLQRLADIVVGNISKWDEERSFFEYLHPLVQKLLVQRSWIPI